MVHVPDTWARFKVRCSVEALCLAEVTCRGPFPSRCLVPAPPLSQEPSRPTWRLDCVHSSCQGTSLETVLSLKGLALRSTLTLRSYFQRWRRADSNITSKYLNLCKYIDVDIFHFHDSCPLATLTKACQFYRYPGELRHIPSQKFSDGTLSLALVNCPKINSCGSRIHTSRARERELLRLPQGALRRRGTAGVSELASSVMSQQELCLRNVVSEDSRFWK